MSTHPFSGIAETNEGDVLINIWKSKNSVFLIGNVLDLKHGTRLSYNNMKQKEPGTNDTCGEYQWQYQGMYNGVSSLFKSFLVGGPTFTS